MRIYLAGPMTGYDQLNFPRFHTEAGRLRELGFTVINPAEINSDASKSWRECMRADIRELVTCDAIALLPGWERSRGAALEHHIMTTLGLAVFTVDELVDLQAKRVACI
ncbi:MAG: DUF4406 domain-containing protein [Paraburkholderia sp.]|nr:MAG: DUF4406 domain-containing protein [Paraburkholderia sp.]